jgi:agmatine deiminase
MTKKPVTIGAIQAKASRDVAANLAKSVKMVRQAAKRGARIICLQELYRATYFPQHASRNCDAFAETIPGESTKAFSRLAKELGAVLIVPIFERAHGGKHYNSAVVIDHHGKLLPTYRKIHLPQDPLFYEQNYFAPGNQGWRVYKTKFATFAVLICYDQWFPEAARMATLAGAEIIFYPTAIGSVVGYRSADGDWHDAWETVMRGHAIANGVHVVAVNRVGREERLRFWGQSFACDSFGKILKRASSSREEVMIAKLNLAHNQRIREGWGFLRNRRPDAYQGCVQPLRSARGGRLAKILAAAKATTFSG